ncbi:MAG TPA: hypothetical protein VF625_06235 [Longimicrobium sp.]|jgi:hypothetical protein
MPNRDEKGNGNNPQPRKRRGRTAQELRDQARELRAEAKKKARVERAEQAKVKKQEETQRKILAGTCMLDYINAARESGDERLLNNGRWLEHQLNRSLIRDRDRRLFGLAPREDLSPEERGLGSKDRKHVGRDT